MEFIFEEAKAMIVLEQLGLGNARVKLLMLKDLKFMEENRDKNQLLTEIITETVYKYLADAGLTSNQDYTIPVEVSNRHVHLTREALDALFGQNYQLTKVRDISQPGEFASDEKVTLVSSKMRVIEGVRIVGPVRAYNQAELTVTDSFILGLSLPTRLSGDVTGSQPITMVGPKGAINLPEVSHQRQLPYSYDT